MTIEEFAEWINNNDGCAYAVETEQEKCVVVLSSGDLDVEDININASRFGIEVKYEHYPIIKRKIRY